MSNQWNDLFMSNLICIFTLLWRIYLLYYCVPYSVWDYHSWLLDHYHVNHLLIHWERREGMCLSSTLYILMIIVGVLMFLFAILIWGSMLVLGYFPKSKLSKWIRSHIITDGDFEPWLKNDLLLTYWHLVDPHLIMGNYYVYTLLRPPCLCW